MIDKDGLVSGISVCRFWLLIYILVQIVKPSKKISARLKTGMFSTNLLKTNGRQNKKFEPHYHL